MVSSFFMVGIGGDKDLLPCDIYAFSNQFLHIVKYTTQNMSQLNFICNLYSLNHENIGKYLPCILSQYQIFSCVLQYIIQWTFKCHVPYRFFCWNDDCDVEIRPPNKLAVLCVNVTRYQLIYSVNIPIHLSIIDLPGQYFGWPQMCFNDEPHYNVGGTGAIVHSYSHPACTSSSLKASVNGFLWISKEASFSLLIFSPPTDMAAILYVVSTLSYQYSCVCVCVYFTVNRRHHQPCCFRIGITSKGLQVGIRKRENLLVRWSMQYIHFLCKMLVLQHGPWQVSTNLMH